MTDTPTRPSLLVRLRDPADREAWAQFVELYAPLVYGFAHKQGLQDADAADLTQEVLRAVARSAAHLDSDPRRGSSSSRSMPVLTPRSTSWVRSAASTFCRPWRRPKW